jgi:DNA-binding NtrC family response regulator
MNGNEENLIIKLIQTESELTKSFNLNNADERERLESLKLLQAELLLQLPRNIVEIIKNKDIMRSATDGGINNNLELINKTTLIKATYDVKSDLYTSINDLNYDCFYYIRMAEIDNSDVTKLSNFPNKDRLSKFQIGDYFKTDLTDTKSLYTIFGSTELSNDLIITFLKKIDKLIDVSLEANPLKIALFFNFEHNTINFEIRRIFFQLILLVLLIKKVNYDGKLSFPEIVFLSSNKQEQELFNKVLSSYQRRGINDSNKRRNFEEKLSELCKKNLTVNPKYIDILKYILYILDEDDIPILLLGESGVGKSYLAKTIHELSSRGKNNFAQINCGVLTGDRLFQQIWGWEKGSFTGAINTSEGLINRAEKGTFFIDEIDRASVEVRNAILTFIENKNYTMLGGKKEKHADIRLIFGSNKNLKKYIKKGQFEPDLYARIAGRIVNIPPLRERLDDIDLMVDYFLETLNEQKKTSITIDKSARDHLKTHSWPMNIRELHRYIKIIFYEVNIGKGNIIRREHLENNPFDDFSISKNDEFNELMEIIKSFLGTWDEKSGKFLEEIIYPIVAKIYKDNYSSKYATKEEVWKKATNIIGISGLNHNKSSLMKYYNDFENVKEKLKIN